MCCSCKDVLETGFHTTTKKRPLLLLVQRPFWEKNKTLLATFSQSLWSITKISLVWIDRNCLQYQHSLQNSIKHWEIVCLVLTYKSCSLCQCLNGHSHGHGYTFHWCPCFEQQFGYNWFQHKSTDSALCQWGILNVYLLFMFCLCTQTKSVTRKDCARIHCHKVCNENVTDDKTDVIATTICIQVILLTLLTTADQLYSTRT